MTPEQNDRVVMAAYPADADCVHNAAPLVAVVDALMAEAKARGALEERRKLAWWLRAGRDGPAGTYLAPGERMLLSELANTLDEHPERWADAPAGP